VVRHSVQETPVKNALNIPLPRGVVFDLDGTLIDSRADIAQACNHVLKWAGREPLPVETVSGYVGDGARSLLARTFAIPEDAPEIDALFAEWQRFYLAHPVDHTQTMPGAVRALRELHTRGIALSIVTNKARAVALAIIEALGIAPQLRALYAGGDGPLKPSPEPIRAMAKAMQLATSELWVVGDGTQDIEAARAAGACAIAVSCGFHGDARLRAAAPDACFASLDDFVDALPPRTATVRFLQ
jgi:phosphoglycolate phosphatase